MRRRLPNRSNNYNGHGLTQAIPYQFFDGPMTICRRMLRTGQEIMINEAVAAHETGVLELRAGSWRPVRGLSASQAMTAILDSGGILITLQACYWKPEARAARRRARRKATHRKAA